MDTPPSVDQVQALFVRDSARIRGFINGLLPDFAQADDVFQEVFLTITRKAGDFAPGSDFQAWVRAIARFKVLEACRDRRKAISMLQPDVLELLANDAPTDNDDRRLRNRALIRCLDSVAPRAREIIELRYLHDLPPESIADRVSWSLNAVHVSLSRVRKFLRTCVQQRTIGNEA
jgi:RNA polymerase sigma-70 factor (ECF subfamily)